MGRKATKFAQQPSPQERNQLQDIQKHGASPVARNRAHAILLSGKGYTLAQLADLFEIDRHTAAKWIERWNTQRMNGLSDAPRPGRDPILSEHQRQQAIDLITQYPRQTKRVIDELQQWTGHKISRFTLYRIARQAGLGWKRARRVTNPPPDAEAVRESQEMVAELAQREQDGEIDLMAFDEARFTLEPSVPYAWQAEERIKLSSRRGGGVSALAFVNTEGQTVPYTTESTVQTEVVTNVFDDFCRHIDKETWVVLDNASPHTSAEFNAKIPEWEVQGLHVYHQAPRCPELNWVEGLWNRIRYQWLPLNATKSLAWLRDCVDDVLAHVGTTYHYHPANPG